MTDNRPRKLGPLSDPDVRRKRAQIASRAAKHPNVLAVSFAQRIGEASDEILAMLSHAVAEELARRRGDDA